jgi:periplasmic divalent cation tolerance protein
LSDEPDDDLCIILTTARTGDEARRIAELLVERRLAACVNILPGARSIYRWQGAIEESAEAMLTIKTSRCLTSAVHAAMREAHSYELPEFLILPIIGGGAEYLAWLRDGLIPGSGPKLAPPPEKN